MLKSGVTPKAFHGPHWALIIACLVNNRKDRGAVLLVENDCIGHVKTLLKIEGENLQEQKFISVF